MNSLKTVMAFEFLGFIKKKKNWTMVIIIAVISLLVAISPLLINLFSGDDDNSDLIYIYSEIYTIEEIEAIFGDEAYPISNEDELNILLTTGEVDEFYQIKEDKITLYTTGGVGMSSQPSTRWFTSIFSTAYYSEFMDEKGLLDDYNDMSAYINNIDIVEVDINTEGATSDEILSVVESDIDSVASASIRYAVGYIFVMLIYISVSLYGGYTATSVGNEKASRTMETLIYSTDSTSLILGKVFGIFLASLIQVLLMLMFLVVGAVVAFSLSASTEFITAGDLDILTTVIFDFLTFKYILLFFVLYSLGFLTNLFIFASLSATVSKVEEISSAISTGTILSMFSFFIGMVLLVTPENKFLIALSYIPFFTPIAMFSRYTMGSASTFDLVYAVVVPTITVVLTGIFAAKLYKVGVLLYGTKPSFKDTILLVFKKDK